MKYWETIALTTCDCRSPARQWEKPRPTTSATTRGPTNRRSLMTQSPLTAETYGRGAGVGRGLGVGVGLGGGVGLGVWISHAPRPWVAAPRMCRLPFSVT